MYTQSEANNNINNINNGDIIIQQLLSSIKSKKNIIPVAYIDDPSCDKHIVEGHQESQERTKSIRNAINKFGLSEFMIKSGSINLKISDMKNIHDHDYIDLIIKCGRLNKPIDIPGSTEISMTNIDSLEAIFAASASVLGAVDTVCGKVTTRKKCKKTKYKYSTKQVRKIFCNIRPPGHRASKNHGAGFCFLNNVAIGAKFAMDKYNSFVKKILIFDWDLHHGDGTEDIFKDVPNVMYVSFHRGGTDIKDKFYSYSGTTYMNELKNVINFPIMVDESVESYMTKFKEEFLPLAYEFNPDLVFISAGFDSHKDDLYHALPLDYCHFQEMTKDLSKLADDCATGRLISVLEGGYDINVLYRCALVHMLTLVDGY